MVKIIKAAKLFCNSSECVAEIIYMAAPIVNVGMLIILKINRKRRQAI
jgi:hypothetical protein